MRRRMFGPDEMAVLWNHGRLRLIQEATGDEDGAAETVRSALAFVERSVRALEEEERDGAEIPSGRWNELCWVGGLAGLGAGVLDICDRAVAAASEEDLAGHRDSRGVALVVGGQLEAAIEDFQAYIDARPPDHATANVRREWEAALRNGVNPLTVQALASLVF